MFRKTSDTTTAITAALVAASGELEDIKREGSASIPTKSGGSYSYRYATLPGILQSVRPVLRKHGLVIIQNASEGKYDAVVISTMLVHESGEFFAFEGLPMPLGSTAQETGSAITYGRRYQLLAVLGLAADDDDDGASAAPRSGFGTEGGVVRQYNGTKTITNKMKGTCIKCHAKVEVGEGLATNDGSGWKTMHKDGDCQDEAF